MKTFKDFLEQTPDFGDDDHDDELCDRMFDFILALEPSNLNEDQQNEFHEILDMIDDEDDDEGMDEVAPARRVRRDPVERRKRAKAHRRNKAKRKAKARKFRKSAKFKQFKRKQKRMDKLGKTSTGKRKRKFIN
jgi:hypothetical protein